MWITVHADRILYVDYGIDTILCDRVMPARGTLVLRMTREQIDAVVRQVTEQ